MLTLIAALWLSFTAEATAQECAGWVEPRDTLAVAWVSPVRRQVFGTTWLEVVSNRDLTALVKGEKAGVGRILQAMGMRRRGSDPKRRFKIVVFEVDRGILCRPIEEMAEGSTVEGVRVCAQGLSRRGPECGRTLDRATKTHRLDVYRVRWRDAARNGFCVIPAHRYAKQAR